MGSLALRDSLPSARVSHDDEGLKLYPVIGDNMEPTLRMGVSMVVGRPCTRYEGEEMYVFEGGVVYQASPNSDPNCISVYSHNRTYANAECPHTYTREQFSAAVVAKVIAAVTLYDHQERQSLWRRAADARREWPEQVSV